MNLSSLNLFLLTLLEEGGAAEEAPTGANPLFMIAAIGAIFWFLVISPERKKRKERDNMVEAMKKGDRIMTTTGMYATIAQIQGDVVTLQIADGVRVKFARAAIQGPADPDAKKETQKAAKPNDNVKQEEPATGTK